MQTPKDGKRVTIPLFVNFKNMGIYVARETFFFLSVCVGGWGSEGETGETMQGALPTSDWV
jgi:hypothetical protein